LLTRQLRSHGCEAFLKANPNINYLLVMNEPNLTSQSNLTPWQAATLRPGYEAVAAHSGVKIVPRPESFRPDRRKSLQYFSEAFGTQWPRIAFGLAKLCRRRGGTQGL
jgi:Glycosyl hydrolase catalytic core